MFDTWFLTVPVLRWNSWAISQLVEATTLAVNIDIDTRTEEMP